MGHAEIDAAAQRRDRVVAMAAVDIPGALPDHRHLSAAAAECLRSHCQLADICDQDGAGHQLRHIKPVVIVAADRDIGAAWPGAGLDARDQLAIGRKHEHMPERRVRHKQPARFVHRQSVGTAGAEGRTEAADLRNVAVLHQRRAPHRIVARHRHEQNGLGGIEHQAVRADAGIDQAIEPPRRRQPIDPPGRIVQAGLSLVGKIDVAIRCDVQIVASLEGFRVARVSTGRILAGRRHRAA